MCRQCNVELILKKKKYKIRRMFCCYKCMRGYEAQTFYRLGVTQCRACVVSDTDNNTDKYD